MSDDTAHSQLTAYLLSILVHHDRGIRAAGPPRNRQEWGIGRIGDYLRAIGRETIVEGGEAALWALRAKPDWQLVLSLAEPYAKRYAQRTLR